jgi:uncharacterized paraquat-inducible protein A
VKNCNVQWFGISIYGLHQLTTVGRDMVESLIGAWNWIVLILVFLPIYALARRRQRKQGFLSCPGCGQEITRKQWPRFTTRFPFSPKAAPCPSCGVALQWAKWPRLALQGACALLAVSILSLAGNLIYEAVHWQERSKSPDVYGMAVVLSYVVTLTAQCLQRFVSANDRDGL